MMVTNILLTIFCVFQHEAFSAFIPDDGINVKSISGAYFEDKSNVVPYEHTAKLFFQVSLPTFRHVKSNCTEADGDEVVCASRHAAMEVQNELVDFLQVSATGTKKIKRQLFLGMAIGTGVGYVLNSVFAKMSHNLFGTEDEAARSISQMRDALVKNQKEHLIFSHAIQDVFRAVNQTMTKWWRDPIWDRRTTDLLFLLEVQAASNKVHRGVERCLQNKIPTQFISPKILRQSLDKIQINVASKGYKLSIPITRFNEYFKLEISDCMITNTSVHILLNIPLQKQDWKVYEILSVPFAFHNQTCRILDLPKAIAVSDQRVETINSNSVFCDLQSSHLCMIPLYAESTPTCSYKLFQKSPLEVLSQTCRITCDNHNPLIITRVDLNRVVITNGKNVRIACNAKMVDVKQPNVGAIELVPKCSCNYTISNNDFDLLQACSVGSYSNDDASIIIPYFWTHPMNVSAYNQSGINTKWLQMLPNITTPEQLEETLDVPAIHYRDVWLSVHSLILVVVCIFFCLACYCLFRK